MLPTQSSRDVLALRLMQKFGPLPSMGVSMDPATRWERLSDRGREIWLRHADDLLIVLDENRGDARR